MKHCFILLFALLVLQPCFTGALADEYSAIADPSEIGVGARPLGMGKAFVGVSDDGSAIYLNPAGMAQFRTWKLSSMSGTILQDVRYVMVGGAYPFSFGTLGLGYVNVGVPGIPITTISGSGTPEFAGDYTDYNAGVFFLSYGSELKRILPSDIFSNVDVGANAKIFLQGFTGGGASIEGASGTGFDIDLGFQYHPSPWASFGLNFINLLPVEMGGKFSWPARGDRDEPLDEAIPMVVKAGVAAKVWGEGGVHSAGGQELILALDCDMRPTVRRPGVWHLGAEWWPTNILAIRAGIDQQPSALESGIGVENNLTGGVGIKYAGFTFDYAYHQYGDVADNTTHYFSLGYIGDDVVSKKKEKIEEVAKPTAKATSEPVVAPVVKPKPELKTFVDVPDGYWAKEAIEYLATLGVMGGYPDETFRPDNYLNRAELSAILVRARGVDPAAVAEKPYPDLDADNWAARYVKAAADMNLVGGYPDGNFQPWKSVSRAEGVTIIVRFAEIPVPEELTTSPFPDVSPAHWAARSIWAASESGMLDFLSGKDFETNKPMTRAEVAEILSKTPWGKSRIKDLLGGE